MTSFVDTDPISNSDCDAAATAYAHAPISPNRTLRNLWLNYSKHIPTSSATSASEIARLGALYPRVETLSISIRCSRGDSNEVARYKALGASFPRLKRLALTLEPPPQPVPTARPPPESLFEDQFMGRTIYTNGHVLNVMAQSAIDAKLTRQVFDAVASPSLETMMIRTLGGTAYPRRPGMPLPYRGQPLWNGMGPFLHGLAREWIVDTINPTGEGKVKEIGGRANSWKSMGTYDPLKVDARDPFLKHFRMLWPETKEGSKGWFDDWESLPLVGI